MKRLVPLLLVLSFALRAFAAEPIANANSLLLSGAVIGNSILAVGERGQILRSTDSGQTWTAIPSPTRAALTAIRFADNQRGWIVGHDGTILHSIDGGDSWTQQFSDHKLSFLDVLTLGTDHAWAVGSFGTFYLTTDSGKTWAPRKILDEDTHLNALAVSGPDDVFLAGERGTVLRSSRNEPVFTATPTGYEGSFFGALALDNNAVLVYGLRGHVFRSEDRGATWQPINLSAPSLILAAVKLKSGTIVIAGQARAFYVSTDNGRSFHAWDAGLTTAVSALLETPDGTLLALGEAGPSRLPQPQ